MPTACLESVVLAMFAVSEKGWVCEHALCRQVGLPRPPWQREWAPSRWSGIQNTTSEGPQSGWQSLRDKLHLIQWRAMRNAILGISSWLSRLRIWRCCCRPVPNRNTNKILGEGENNSFIALPGKGGSQQTNASKTLPPLEEFRRWFYSLGSEV